jgi:hypothetical protein
MKTIAVIVFSVVTVAFASCGDMSHNTNEEHTHYMDSSGMNADGNTGAPNTSTAPMRDIYPTDTDNKTNGPDNAVPKSSSFDSTRSIQNNR